MDKKHLKTATRIKECLAERNMKASELAEIIGVNRSAVTHYTNGTYCPKNDTAQKIAEVFHVSPLWIMGLTDERQLPEVDTVVKFDDGEEMLIERLRTTDPATRAVVFRLLGLDSDKRDF